MTKKQKGTAPLRRCTQAFVAWCADDSPAAKFERTVAQGTIGAVAVGLTTGEWGAAFATAIAMAVISPVQAQIGMRSPASGDGADERNNE